jgi:outer membrane biogenesis lipoprotein LolB
MSRSEGRRTPCGLRPAPVALAALLAVAGCATTPTPAPPEPPATAATDRAAVGPRDWAGRFSVRLQANDTIGRQDAADGRFALASVPATGGRLLELELSSPFGQTLARARRQPDGAATLVLADGRTLRAGSLDALLEQALGLPLPIDRLPDWLDDRFETVISRDAQGGVAAASDSGWRIERETRRWTLQRQQAGGELRVVLLLDR